MKVYFINTSAPRYATLSLGLCTFLHRNLDQPSVTTHFVLDLFIRKPAALVLAEEKRVHSTQPNYSFRSGEKWYTFRENMTARFLNVIKLKKQQNRYSLQWAASTLEIPQYCTTLERKHLGEHGNDHVKSPLKNVWPNWCPHIHTPVSNFSALRD